MKVSVQDIPREGLELQYDSDAAALDLGNIGARFRAPIRVRVRLCRSGESVSISGETEAEADLQCVRCLGPVSIPLHLMIQMVLDPEPTDEEPERGEHHELHRGELDLDTYTGKTLDLAGLVREQVLLGLPEYPLCRTDCRGLCTGCGADLNREDCACPGRAAGPPSGPFQERLKKNNPKSKP